MGPDTVDPGATGPGLLSSLNTATSNCKIQSRHPPAVLSARWPLAETIVPLSLPHKKDLMVAWCGFVYPSSMKPNLLSLSGKALELYFSVGWWSRESWKNMTEVPRLPHMAEILESCHHLSSAYSQVGGTVSSLSRTQPGHNRIFYAQTS